jgi:hypothetical protein
VTEELSRSASRLSAAGGALVPPSRAEATPRGRVSRADDFSADFDAMCELYGLDSMQGARACPTSCLSPRLDWLAADRSVAPTLPSAVGAASVVAAGVFRPLSDPPRARTTPTQQQPAPQMPPQPAPQMPPQPQAPPTASGQARPQRPAAGRALSAAAAVAAAAHEEDTNAAADATATGTAAAAGEDGSQPQTPLPFFEGMRFVLCALEPKEVLWCFLLRGSEADTLMR